MKKYKYVEDLMEDYLSLNAETIELPLTIAAAREKQILLLNDINGNIVKKGDADDLFKVFMQVRKAEERQAEVKQEKGEVEELLKQFLLFINGSQLSYEKKDDTDKQKITYLFWIENGEIKTNR